MRNIYILMAAAAILVAGCKSNGSKKAAAEVAKAEEVAAKKAKVMEETIQAIEAEEEVNVREAVEKLSAIDAEGVVESLAETLEKNPDYAVPFAVVENKPTFAGGDANDFSKWVGENLVYPQEAIDQKLEGRVILQFTVNKEGDVKDVTVLRGVNDLLDSEAVRVVSASPKWEVGTQNGIPVAVKYVFPVIFKIHE